MKNVGEVVKLISEGIRLAEVEEVNATVEAFVINVAADIKLAIVLVPTTPAVDTAVTDGQSCETASPRSISASREPTGIGEYEHKRLKVFAASSSF